MCSNRDRHGSCPPGISSSNLSCRSCEERTLKKINKSLISFFSLFMLLNKNLIMVGKQIVCFSLVHLAELVLKVKNQLLICQVFLIRKCLIFIWSFTHIAVIFGI